METKVLFFVALISTILLISCGQEKEKPANKITEPQEALGVWNKDHNKIEYYYRWEDLVLAQIDTISSPKKIEIFFQYPGEIIPKRAYSRLNELIFRRIEKSNDSEELYKIFLSENLTVALKAHSKWELLMFSKIKDTNDTTELYNISLQAPSLRDLRVYDSALKKYVELGGHHFICN